MKKYFIALLIFTFIFRNTMAQSIVGNYACCRGYFVNILSDSTLTYKLGGDGGLIVDEFGFGKYKIEHDSIISVKTIKTDSFYKFTINTDTAVLREHKIRVVILDKTTDKPLQFEAVVVKGTSKDFFRGAYTNETGTVYFDYNKVLKSVNIGRLNLSIPIKDSSQNNIVASVLQHIRVSENEKFYFKISNQNRSIITGKFFYKTKMSREMKREIRSHYPKRWRLWHWHFRKKKIHMHSHRIYEFKKVEK